jgi:predicted dehydrogenase
LKNTKLCAELNVFVPGRLLDDDGAVIMRFDNGARGVLIATQIAAGEENDIRVRVYGDKGGLDWRQMEPNTLVAKWVGKPMEIYRVGTSMGAAAKANSRVPGGHPEGYLEAFANIYRNFSFHLRARMNGEEPKPEWLDYPGVEDGIRGMKFIDAVVEAGYNDQVKWVPFN